MEGSISEHSKQQLDNSSSRKIDKINVQDESSTKELKIDHSNSIGELNQNAFNQLSDERQK